MDSIALERQTDPDAEAYLDEYLATAERDEDDRLFPSFDRKTGRPASSATAHSPASRRSLWSAAAPGIVTPIGCHSFRATGITAYLSNGGTIDKAQQIAAHESPRTTKLYDRTQDVITLEPVMHFG